VEQRANFGRIYIKQLGQFGQYLLAFDDGQDQFCFEAGVGWRAGSFRDAGC
jgi:hypothetical protein